MRTETRQKFDAYLTRQGVLNGGVDAATKFTVTPSVEQKLEDRIRESAQFLNEINVIGVGQQKGDKLGLGISGPAAGRTDTRVKDREPRDLAALDGDGYECAQTNFDTFVTYNMLDAWAKFQDFQARLRNQVTQQIARDRLMIGWNGVTAAASTDITAHPLLQDVNTGWLTHIRAKAPGRVMTGVKVGADVVGHDYVSFDALVFDAVNELLDEWHRDAPDIVAIVGRQLIADKYLTLINDAKAPTEIQALNNLILNKTMGGKKAVNVPYVPARSILITSASNLSIYFQNGTRRRQIEDQPRRDRIVDFQSVNEAYVVEDFGKCALIDGIKLPTAAGEWA